MSIGGISNWISYCWYNESMSNKDIKSCDGVGSSLSGNNSKEINKKENERG